MAPKSRRRSVIYKYIKRLASIGPSTSGDKLFRVALFLLCVRVCKDAAHKRERTALRLVGSGMNFSCRQALIWWEVVAASKSEMEWSIGPPLGLQQKVAF